MSHLSSGSRPIAGDERGSHKGMLDTTRGTVLLLLCRGPQTVSDLAARLDLTDNAVRAQLARLQRDRFVQPAGSRHGVRRPHVEYELTGKARDLFPRAYEPALRHLMHALIDRLPPAASRDLLLETGRRALGQYLRPLAARGPRQRLMEAVEQLNGSGFGIILTQDGGRTVVRACSCPLASVTASRPEVCAAFAQALGEFLGTEVHEACERGAAPQCCFRLASDKKLSRPRD